MEAEREYVLDHLGREHRELGRERLRERREVGLLVLFKSTAGLYFGKIYAGSGSCQVWTIDRAPGPLVAVGSSSGVAPRHHIFVRRCEERSRNGN